MTLGVIAGIVLISSRNIGFRDKIKLPVGLDPLVIAIAPGVELIDIGAVSERDHVASEIPTQANRVVVAIGKRPGKAGELQISKLAGRNKIRFIQAYAIGNSRLAIAGALVIAEIGRDKESLARSHRNIGPQPAAENIIK